MHTTTVELVIQAEWTITFYTDPVTIGSITFASDTYANYETGRYIAGPYSVTPNAPSGWSFNNWITTGGVSILGSTATVTSSGTIKAVFVQTTRVHNLDTGLDYLTIQAAIDASETLAGHTILVDAGTYYENVVITKPISLIGEDGSNTVIDGGGGTSPVFDVTNVNNVEISRFTIQNVRFGFYILGSSDCTLTENRILDSFESGLIIQDSSSNFITNNQFSWCSVGILLEGSSFNVISQNSLAYCDKGISFRDSSSNNVVFKNGMAEADTNGLELINMCDENTFFENSFSYAHILIEMSRGNKFYHNSFFPGYPYQVYVINQPLGWSNTWDNGYPSGGNFWLAYLDEGADENGDEIGDTPFIIDENNQDNYPLMNEYYPRIYIKADGSIEPTTAPIQREGDRYILTEDITYASSGFDGIFVGRNNIILDGANHLVEGSGTPSRIGVLLVGRENVTITNMRIRLFGRCICLRYSSNNSILANNITSDYNYGSGLRLDSSSNNLISRNNITNNYYYGLSIGPSSNYNTISANNITNNNNCGAEISSSNNIISENNISANGYKGISVSSTNNILTRNNITNNYYGIELGGSNNVISENDVKANGCGLSFSSSSNSIFHNTFEDNTQQAEIGSPSHSNIWDNGYPSGGNYWSDYAGADSNGDGIGDTPYVIDASNVDHYPLMNLWAPVTDLASLVVRGGNNQIYYRLYDSTSGAWDSWSLLPGSTVDSPAAAVCVNELHVVIRGSTGNTLYHGYMDLTTKAFSGWTLLSGASPSAPTLTANGTHLCLVVRGNNNFVYYRFYDCALDAWTGWTALPSGSTRDTPAATMLAGKLHVVVKGTGGNSVWHCTVDLSTQAFSGWQSVGGSTPSRPVLAMSEARGEAYLVVRGSNNLIYRNTWSITGWAGWTALPTGSTRDGPAATVIGDSLHVVVKGAGGNTLWHSTLNLDTSAFTSWTLVTGSTPSAPTLTS